MFTARYGLTPYIKQITFSLQKVKVRLGTPIIAQLAKKVLKFYRSRTFIIVPSTETVLSQVN